MESIVCENVSKVYQLYDKPIDRLKETFSIRRKKYHKKFTALNPISFTIEKGLCYGIIGVNGSGKSTLLKIITGVLTQTTGNVTVNGKISALLELGAGFNLEFTGLENIYLNGTIMGYTREEMQSKVEAIKDFADIGEFINQPVKTYSSGMFARLAFAVAINVEPDILIVDEALSVGDIYFQAKCYQKFDEFKNLGKTIVFVSHDMGSVLKYCDTVMLLNKGNLVKIGKPAEVIDLYKKVLSNQIDEVNRVNNLVVGEWKSHLAINANPDNYGNKLAEIVDFGIFDYEGKLTNSILKNSYYFVKVKVQFNADIDNAIVAYTIKSTKGVDLTGTNTFLENKSLGMVKKNEVITISFKQLMTLQKGEYLLNLGVTKFDHDHLEIFNRIYNAISIDVISTKDTVGYFDSFSEIEIRREE